jgi:hypothetical protein
MVDEHTTVVHAHIHHVARLVVLNSCDR